MNMLKIIVQSVPEMKRAIGRPIVILLLSPTGKLTVVCEPSSKLAQCIAVHYMR